MVVVLTPDVRVGTTLPTTFPRNFTHVLVHWESFLQGSVNPAAEPALADSDIIRVRSSHKTQSQARKAKVGDRSRSHAAEASPPAAVRRRVSRARYPSTAGKAGPKPMAMSPVHSLRRLGQGRDSGRLRGKLAVTVQSRERRRRQGRVKHEQPYQAHT